MGGRLAWLMAAALVLAGPGAPAAGAPVAAPAAAPAAAELAASASVAAVPAPAALADPCAPRPVDLVLVLDDSGSMAQGQSPNDPDNLRITAAHLLVDLLGPGDRAGLVLFSDTVRPVPLQDLPAGAEALHRSIDGFASRGGTRIDAAVAAGLALLDADAKGSGAPPGAPARRQAMLLLTDGRPDRDPAAQAARLQELAAEAGTRDVTIYALGLGPAYDRNLLLQISTTARSPLVWKVRGPADLTDAFLAVLHGLKGINVVAAPDGEVQLSPLARRATVVRLRPAGVRGTAGQLRVGRGLVPVRRRTPGPGEQFLYDLAVIAAPPAAEVRFPGEVTWLIEEPGVQLAPVSPAPHARLPAGEAATVSLRLSACPGMQPPALEAAALLLDPDRRPVGPAVPLAQAGDSPDLMTGHVVLPRPGPFLVVLQVGSGGRRLAQAEVTVEAVVTSVWTLSAPAAAGSWASIDLTLTHRRGGQPAAAESPPEMTATLPDGRTLPVPLAPAAAPGAFTARFDGHMGLDGSVNFTVAAVGQEQLTRLEPTEIAADPPGPLRWGYGDGGSRMATLRLSLSADVPPDRLPELALDGVPFAAGPSRWERTGPGRYTAAFAVRPLTGGPRPDLAARLAGVIFGRRFLGRVELRPAGGIRPMPGVALALRVDPLLPGWPLLAAVATLLLGGAAARRRLLSGPRGRVWLVGPGGEAVNLLGRRGWAARLAAPWRVRVGGPGSRAEVRCAWLPPGALARVEALPPRGRDRFRIINLNPAVPLDGAPELGGEHHEVRLVWGGVPVVFRCDG